jgi:hypothetical protein
LDSLVRVGRIALEAINRASLSGSEGEPFLGGILQIDEELLTAAAREEVQVLAFIDFDLVGKLAALNYPARRTSICFSCYVRRRSWAHAWSRPV